MNVVNALLWWQWLMLGGAAATIVALYFLKLRRRPVIVSSTYLWTRTMEDLHVNALWQRLRRNLLLWLQMAAIALAALACIQPGCRQQKLPGNRFIFLIDTSASMSATDVAPNRLEVARRQVKQLIEQMDGGDAAMIMSFSDEARVEQPFSSLRRVLRRKVDRIQPTQRRTDLAEALRAAAGLANPGRTSADAGDVQVAEALPATLYIFSDGGFPNVNDFMLGNLTPVYVTIGTPQAQNVAVAALEAESSRRRAGEVSVYARLDNHGRSPATADVELYREDRLVDAGRVTIAPGDSEGIMFELANIEEGPLRLEAKYDDALALDNTAYTIFGSPRRARVLVISSGNPPLRYALTTSEARQIASVTLADPEILGSDEYRREAETGAYDLIIYDRCAPDKMPQSNTLMIGAVPPAEPWARGENVPLPQIVDVDRSHPMTQLVEMGNVKYIDGGFTVKGPLGSDVLFEGDTGPLLVLGRRDTFEDAVLGFEIFGADETGQAVPKTDWPGRRSFPIFVMNALQYLGGLRDLPSTRPIQPGEPVRLRGESLQQRLVVETPTGKRIVRDAASGTPALFTETDHIGIYRVRRASDGQIVQQFAVNLFDGRESQVAARGTVELGYQELAGQPPMETTRSQLWKVLLLIALGVLVAEWIIYQRRIYV